MLIFRYAQLLLMLIPLRNHGSANRLLLSMFTRTGSDPVLWRETVLPGFFLQRAVAQSNPVACNVYKYVYMKGSACMNNEVPFCVGRAPNT